MWESFCSQSLNFYTRQIQLVHLVKKNIFVKELCTLWTCNVIAIRIKCDTRNCLALKVYQLYGHMQLNACFISQQDLYWEQKY